MHRGKIAVILLSVLIVVSLALAGGIFYLLQVERKHSQELNEELKDVTAQKKVLEAELAKSKEAAASLDFKVREASSAVVRLNDALEQEKNAKQQALYELGRLNNELEQQRLLRQELEKKFSSAASDIEKLQAELKEVSEKKKEIEDKLIDSGAAAQGVELGTIVVSGEGQQPFPAAAREQVGRAPAALEGKVLVINKDHNFVVLNLGSKDGLRIGDLFSIYRGSKFIGDVKVEKVHNAMSAAGFPAQELKEKISEGDRAVKK